MSSVDIDYLHRRLGECRLRLEFAQNFLREVQNDGQTGFDHEAALGTAVRAVADAEAEYARVNELLAVELERQRQMAECIAVERPSGGLD